MTKKTFIILTSIYFLFFISFVVSLFRQGHETIGMAIAALAILTWGFVKIKYEVTGFKEKDEDPDTF